MSRIAVIPARGGSKRIPRKNVKNFCGKPIIAWSIEVAQNSGCFDKVIVSTDDPEIADTARRFGADVPFMRPVELSDDYTGTIPVIRHAVEWISQNGYPVEFACCIYATAPFVTSSDLQQGMKLLKESGTSYALSVTSYPFPIQRAVRISTNGRLTMFNPEHFQSRSQDLEEAWHDAGQFYWGTAEAWCEERGIFNGDSIPIRLPRYRVQDIDTLEDWTRAEWLFKAMQAQGALS